MENQSAEKCVVLKVVNRDGQVKDIPARTGEPLMFALSEQDTGVEAVCGGCLSCATCHIYVDEGLRVALPPVEDAEMELISGLLHAQPNSRLSCQVIVKSCMTNMSITIAPPEA